MSAVDDRGQAPAAVSPRWRLVGGSLDLLGVVVVGAAILRLPVAPWVLALSAVSLAAWAARGVRRGLGGAGIPAPIALAMILPAALAAAATAGAACAPLAVGVAALGSDRRRPVRDGGAAAGLAAAAVLVGEAIHPVGAVWGVVGMLAAALVPLALGLARRRSAEAELQTREAEDREREAELRSSLLADRQAVARDVHDVLAHSLGGLVVQLDAIEALLEAGRVEDAATRVAGARRLAASGLDDARRAVATLREPARDGELHPAARTRRIELSSLADQHRALGGALELDEHGPTRAVGPPLATALERALQEALTNARRHAPGEGIRARLSWHDDRVDLEVRNRMPSSRPAGSGGHGLIGLHERFAALEGGSSSAGAEDGDFVMRAGASVVPDARAAGRSTDRAVIPSTDEAAS